MALVGGKSGAHHGNVIALVEVEAALHADTLLPLQLPKDQLTGMSLYCSGATRKKGGVFFIELPNVNISVRSQGQEAAASIG